MQDITMEIRFRFLEEIVGIDQIDLEKIPISLIEYYINLVIYNENPRTCR